MGKLKTIVPAAGQFLCCGQLMLRYRRKFIHSRSFCVPARDSIYQALFAAFDQFLCSPLEEMN